MRSDGYGLKSSVTDEAAIAMAKGFYGARCATGRVSSAILAARKNLRLWSRDSSSSAWRSSSLGDGAWRRPSATAASARSGRPPLASASA
ncbi:MAG TPA: hypothetical protein VFT22_23135 [Kofleriaceae bacterium]|nr:hypothetical protein [Kofleriaceae bacterium]